ncbi:peptide deformylase [Paenibacillus sp. M-152]|uniref:peptide deformylase n=1 Tax=Paenibacillus sp. M-152 TaxID=2487928 RepID=UPI000F70429C|nr:peptide deformylase [Paenibacillus sp. M-152]AZH31210.1 peptide deformylase [Paenibacillus sp. M-152]
MSNQSMDMLLTKDIVREGEPILRKKVDPVCLPLSEEDLQQMQWMLDYLKNSQNEELATRYELRPGVGLSANQVGLNKRMCAIYYEDGDQMVEYALFNPKLVSHSTSMIYLEQGEGCLSVDRYIPGYVPRYEKIRIKANLPDGTQELLTFKGYAAIVVQHEMDHLDGIMFYDRINPEDPHKLPQGVHIEPFVRK